MLTGWFALLQHPILHGAGVAAYKEQPFHSDSMAKPLVYARIINSTPIDIHLDLGTRQTALERSKIAATIEIPEQPVDIRSESELDPVRAKYEELKSFADRYTKCAAILKPYIDNYSKIIVRFNSGEILYSKSWITKDYYDLILKRQKEADEAFRKQQKARMEEMRIEREKEEAFAKSQREKGLELYRNEWLPRAEALKRLKTDREELIAWEKIKAKSILSSVYSIFQVLDNGMLIKPHQGQLENSGINVEIAFLSGVIESAAADGDLYKGDLYWCGNYSYQTKGGSDSTVNAYCLDKTEAIKKVRQILFESEEHEEEGKAGESNPKIASELPEPLKGAESSGSGFFVGTEGYFVTNAHVVNDAKNIFIYYNEGMHPAEVVKVSKIVDLALLKVSLKVIGLEISSDEPQPGNDVFALGYPAPRLQGLDVKVTKGVISSTKGLDDDDTQFQIDAAVQPGNSGGPLCDSTGRVIGVVVAGLNQIAVANAAGFIPQNVNYGIKANEVSALLRTKSIKDSVPNDAGMKADNQANVIKMASSRTGLVIIK